MTSVFWVCFFSYMVMSLDPLGTRRPDLKLFGYGTNLGIVS